MIQHLAKGPHIKQDWTGRIKAECKGKLWQLDAGLKKKKKSSQLNIRSKSHG